MIQCKTLFNQSIDRVTLPLRFQKFSGMIIFQWVRTLTPNGYMMKKNSITQIKHVMLFKIKENNVFDRSVELHYITKKKSYISVIQIQVTFYLM